MGNRQGDVVNKNYVRICKYFIDNVNTNRQGEGMKIAINSEMLGEYMAVTQRSVNRILKQLKESGIIEITKAHIVIKNFEKLLEEECQPARKTEKQGKKKG